MGMKTLHCRSIPLSSKTAYCMLGLIVKKFQLLKKASEYYLVEVWGMWSKNFLFILLDGKLLVPKGNRLILWGEILWPLVGTKELKRLFCTCNVHPLLKNRPCINAGVPIKADYWWSSADYETAREKVLVILVKVIYVLVLYVGWQILLKTSLKNQTITQEVSLVCDAD